MGAVAIWGSGDLPSLGDQILGRIVQQELQARLPGWRMSLFAPLGWDRQSVTDGGVVAEPLYDYVPGRVDALAGGVTVSVLCPTFPLGLSAAELSRLYGDERAGATAALFSEGLADHPVLLFGVRVAEEVPPALVALAERTPVISVRDEESRDRLRTAGVSREIPVIPHPAVLVRSVVDVDTLPERREQLHQLGDIEADPVLEDRLAIIAETDLDDEHVAAVLAGLRASVADHVVAAQLDRIAEVARRALAESDADLHRPAAILAKENAALRHAHWRQHERIVIERQRLAEPLADALHQRDTAVEELAEAKAATEELRRRNEELAARVADCERELGAWQSTKLVRWSRPLRQAYGRVRGR